MNVATPVSPATEGVYLRACLAPLAAALEQPDVTDIYVNQPGEIWIERLGGSIQVVRDARIDEATLGRLARQLAALAHQGISREQPLLSARLPDGARVQIVAPPATRGPLALAIRKHVAPKISLLDYEADGLFALQSTSAPKSASIEELMSRGAFAEALAAAVHQRKNILVSGGTSSGKTTFLNALLREVPRHERLILIEDTPELSVDHENHIGLLAVRGSLGEAQVTANDLLSASLRMRPDRIILGELRGTEAFAFLRAINSGHPGSMSTIHADSPQSAVEQLALLVLQCGTSLGRDDILHYVRRTIDLFVQLGRAGDKRTIENIVINSRA